MSLLGALKGPFRKKRVRKRRIQVSGAHAPEALPKIDLQLPPRPEPPPVQARVIDIHGTLGRNATEPLKPRRRW